MIWVLIIGLGTNGTIVIPNLPSEQTCIELAKQIEEDTKSNTWKCYSYPTGK